MPAVYEKSLLFAQFLASDAQNWIRFVPALPFQAAYYCDILGGRGVLHRFLLQLTAQGSKQQRRCRVALEVGSHTTTPGGLILDVISTAREVPMEISGLNFAGAKWPAIQDPLVRKAREIALTASGRFGPLPGPLLAYTN